MLNFWMFSNYFYSSGWGNGLQSRG